MGKNRTVLGMTLILVGILGSAYALSSQWLIQNNGIVHTRGIEAFWHQNLTLPVTRIDWPTLFPGQTTSVSAWVHNPGNSPILVSMRTENWSPAEASVFIDVQWDREAARLEGRETLQVNFTLHVSQAVVNATVLIEHYSFDIWVTAADAP